MESLETILERNRKQARKLMMDNNITHISITDNDAFGKDTDVPFVLLPTKNGEQYETEVSAIKLINDDIFVQVVNTTDLSSNVYVDNEGYIQSHNSLYYTDNEVYRAIEYYFDNYLQFEDKIYTLGKELEQKFVELLSNEDERSFTFEDCNMFHECKAGVETKIKDIYMEGCSVMVRTDEGIVFYLFALSLENKCNLLKHFVGCLKDKC